MTITVDPDVCFGSGECVLAAPQTFDISDDGVAFVRPDAVRPDPSALQSIADNCPSRAIRLESATAATTLRSDPTGG